MIPPLYRSPILLLHQRSVYQSMRTQVKRVMALLRKNFPKLAPEVLPDAEAVFALETEILNETGRFLEKKFLAMRVRIHGDYHLGQVLFTGEDFVIIDFEGEPSRTLSERRIKRSPLRDVAGMLHSFHYAANAVLYQRDYVRVEDLPFLEPWTETWHRSVGGSFLNSYLAVAGQAGFIPESREDVETMLSVFLLDKAIYVLGYELNNRPGWVVMPLRQIRGLLGHT